MIKEKTLEKIIQYGGSLLVALAILVIGLLVIKLVLRIEEKALSRTRLDKSVHKFVMTATRYTLYIILAVVILTSLKVPTAPLVTVLGACGAAVALALKDSLGNIAGGIIILAKDEQSLKVESDISVIDACFSNSSISFSTSDVSILAPIFFKMASSNLGFRTSFRITSSTASFTLSSLHCLR